MPNYWLENAKSVKRPEWRANTARSQPNSDRKRKGLILAERAQAGTKARPLSKIRRGVRSGTGNAGLHDERKEPEAPTCTFTPKWALARTLSTPPAGDYTTG